MHSAGLPNDVLTHFPTGLPEPVDDGACDHLIGVRLPSVTLPSTVGDPVDFSQVPGWLVIYCYPMTGRPGQAIPAGWIDIPGAAGCTPQACSFRDQYSKFQALQVRLFGLSAQTPEQQLEAWERLHLPFELVSDAALEWAQGLRLPLFEIAGMHLIKRLTLIVKDGTIVKCFYPVFPPDTHADDVLAWLAPDPLRAQPD